MWSTPGDLTCMKVITWHMLKVQSAKSFCQNVYIFFFLSVIPGNTFVIRYILLHLYVFAYINISIRTTAIAVLTKLILVPTLNPRYSPYCKVEQNGGGSLNFKPIIYSLYSKEAYSSDRIVKLLPNLRVNKSKRSEKMNNTLFVTMEFPFQNRLFHFTFSGG